MFQGAHGKIKKISSEEIIECYEHNESLMEGLEGAHDKFLDRIASLQTSTQPYVVKYVADALMEEDEGEDAVQLTEEQKGFLYLLLKTVIDVLDQKDIGWTLQEKEMDRIKSKWDFLLQCRPDIRGVVGNTRLVGGRMRHNIKNEMIFDFITKKGTFSYNESTDEFKSKLEIR